MGITVGGNNMKERVYWDKRYKKEVEPFFDLHKERNPLLASDITWSIRRLKSDRKNVTTDKVFGELLEHYYERWSVLSRHGKIRETLFKNAVNYYKDWENLSEEEKTPIRESRQKSFMERII